MRWEAAAYKNRMQIAWSNVQANRRVRPADFINGFQFVQPLRALGSSQESFDLAHLAMELFTRLRMHYEPRTTPGSWWARPTLPRPVLPPRATGPRVGLFVDAPDHLSGVCLTIAEWQEQARRNGYGLIMHTCSPGMASSRDRVVFSPMGSIRLDAYSGLTLHVPRMKDVLRYIDAMNFDVIHVSTPGPVGLLGLLAARQRGLPVCGTYHTDFPRYAGELTGDPALEQTGWQFMQWFYGQMDRVAAPTESIRRALVEHGFDDARLRVVGRGVDTNRFTPAARDAGLRKRWSRERSLKLLYVGRLSREKNLETLARAFKRLHPTRPDLSLVLVGEGPFRAELEALLAGLPVHFAGTLKGDELARAYASCDLFVFPSKTDTFGRVVLEAQASGLPVVVSSEGGPKDAMEDGRTGVVVPELEEASLAAAMDRLTDDPGRMAAYGSAARQFARSRSPEASFDAFWGLHHVLESRTTSARNEKVMA